MSDFSTTWSYRTTIAGDSITAVEGRVLVDGRDVGVYAGADLSETPLVVSDATYDSVAAAFAASMGADEIARLESVAVERSAPAPLPEPGPVFAPEESQP